MYAVSDRFLQQIRQSGRVKTVVDVYYGGDIIATDIPISEGSITAQRDGDIRRSGRLTIPEDTLVPAFKNDTLVPYGTEIAIRSGVVYSDGSTELVPMGIFTLEDTEWEEGPKSHPEINFFDRTKVLMRHNLPYPIDQSGEQISSVIAGLMGQSFITLVPTYTIDPSLPDYKLPGGTVYDQAVWDVFNTFAEALSAEIYFDVDGNLQVAPMPMITADTANGDAVWTVDVGDNGVLISAQRGISRSETYNSIIVKGATPGSGTGAQPYAILSDLDPLSKTYWFGSFGKHRKVIENSALTSYDACYRVATQELNKLTGLAKSVSFNSLRNPALEPGDILLFNFFDGEQELHILDSYTFDFASGSMSGTTRSRVSNL